MPLLFDRRQILHSCVAAALLTGRDVYFAQASGAQEASRLTLGFRLDGQSARAVLQALNTPGLSQADASKIAHLPGNQGLIRKQSSTSAAATEQDFVDALVAAARGEAVTSDAAQSFGFAGLKARSTELQGLLDRIETNQNDFQGWVKERVTRFAPDQLAFTLQGFLIVGGGSGGYAFGEPQFFLNLAYFDDYDVAKTVMAHELYHAMQAAAAPSADDDLNAFDAATATRNLRESTHLRMLFGSLYAEGSATLVGDPLLISRESSDKAKAFRAAFAANVRRIEAHATLLEMSVISLQAPQPPNYSDVYELGFFVPEPLYALGYVMAQAIQKAGGDAALAQHATLPGYRFVQAYAGLPNYGKDRDHLKLGTNTLAAVSRIEREGAFRPLW